jgi:hypothetical protein
MALWSSEAWKTICPTTQSHLPKLLVQIYSDNFQNYLSKYMVTTSKTTCPNMWWWLSKLLVQIYSDISQKPWTFSCQIVQSLPLFYCLYELTQHLQMKIAIIATSSVGGRTLIVTGIMRPHVRNDKWISVWRQHHSWSCVRGDGQVILTPWHLQNTESSEDVWVHHCLTTVGRSGWQCSSLILCYTIQIHGCVATLFANSSHSSQANKACICITETALTLSVCVEYTYSVASHASHPDGVPILHHFHKFVKWAGTGDFKV